MGGKTAGLAADTRFTLTEMSTTADKRVIGHGAPPRERRNEVRGWYSSPSLRADPPVSQGLPGLGSDLHPEAMESQCCCAAQADSMKIQQAMRNGDALWLLMPCLRRCVALFMHDDRKCTIAHWR